MKITKIQGTNMELTDAIRGRVEKRVAVLAKLVKRVQPATVDVEVGKPSDHHKKGDVYYAEMNANINGEHMRAESTSDDLYRAIDEVQKELRRQILNWRKKNKRKVKEEGRSFKDMLRFGR